MTSRSQILRQHIATVLLASAGFSAALAAPSIQMVFTEYTAAGIPQSINIVGTGFACGGCGSPKVRLGGYVLEVQSFGEKVVSAKLPGLLSDGAYSLEVATGPAPAGGVTRFSLMVAASASSDEAVAVDKINTMGARRATVGPSPVIAKFTAAASSSASTSIGKSRALPFAVPFAISPSGSKTTVFGSQATSSGDTYTTAYGDYALTDPCIK